MESQPHQHCNVKQLVRADDAGDQHRFAHGPDQGADRIC
jgi:hypothetical protein